MWLRRLMPMGGFRSRTWPSGTSSRSKVTFASSRLRPRSSRATTQRGPGGAACDACPKPDSAYVWTNENWRLHLPAKPWGLPAVLLLEPRGHYDLEDLPTELVAEMGPLLQRVASAVMSLGGIARVHVDRVGDGARHLHWWFMARPRGCCSCEARPSTCGRTPCRRDRSRSGRRLAAGSRPRINRFIVAESLSDSRRAPRGRRLIRQPLSCSRTARG